MTIARPFFCALALVAVGCGDDDDDDDMAGPTCSTAPCGGDITGTWTIDQTCPDVVPAANDQCPDAVIDITDGPDVTGTASFDAGGAYSLDVHVTAAVDVHIPADCTLNGTIRCDSLPALLEQQEGVTGATCVDGAEESSCDCSFSIDTDETEDGTWTTAGSTLTVTVDAESTDSQYCAQGTGLLVIMNNDLGEVSITASKQ